MQTDMWIQGLILICIFKCSPRDDLLKDHKDDKNLWYAGSPHHYSWQLSCQPTLTLKISPSLALHTWYHCPILKCGNFASDMWYLFEPETLFPFFGLSISVVNLCWLLGSRLTLCKVGVHVGQPINSESWVLTEPLVKLRSWLLSAHRGICLELGTDTHLRWYFIDWEFGKVEKSFLIATNQPCTPLYYKCHNLEYSNNKNLFK